MKGIVLRGAVGFGAAIVVAALALAAIRFFSDGPIAVLPGGPMSGPHASGPFPEFDTPPGGLIELQVEGWRPSSRTVIGFLHDGNLYVPAVRAESKWWPKQVLENPGVFVRHMGSLYKRRASRVTDPLLMSSLRETVTATERLSSEIFTAQTTWYFRLDPM
ncbi:MAG: hypothetical protein GY725_04230 [bacterium]|nr:hypothetical protein [bacterium]